MNIYWGYNKLYWYHRYCCSLDESCYESSRWRGLGGEMFDYVHNWWIAANLLSLITHWGRVTQICVGKRTMIGSDNGLSPGRRQAIIWTSAGILLIGPLVTNSSEFLIVIYTFSFSKMHLIMSSAKWRPFCLDINVLMRQMSWDDVAELDVGFGVCIRAISVVLVHA